MPKKLYKIDTGEEVDLEELLSEEDLAPAGSKRDIAVSKGRHRLFWPLLLVSLFLLVFIVNYWYSSLKKTMTYSVPDFIKEQLTGKDDQVVIAELKIKDTDQDGLTDFQEIYQYHTSIFLPDTDSDGISDAEEANSGADPLCPTGQQCNLLKLITPQTKLADILQDISIDKDLTLEQATANEFRKFLLASGVPQEELDKLTDEDLLNILAAVDESQIVSESAWSATTTPDQVRTFLLSQPNAVAEQINALSEEELLKIRDQLIGSQ